MNSNFFLKLCAVPCSLLLVAAFVSYRAGALDWLKTSDERAPATPLAPESTSVHESALVEPAPVIVPVNTVPVDTANQHLFYGSKSGMVVGAPILQPAKADEPVNSSGSESLLPTPATPDAVFIEPEPTSPVVQPPEEAVIFGGSKSLMPAPATSQR